MYCLTQLYDGRDMYGIYYIKNNYMFSASHCLKLANVLLPQRQCLKEVQISKRGKDGSLGHVYPICKVFERCLKGV